MVKREDLRKAVNLEEEIKTQLRLRTRLLQGEPIRVLVGAKEPSEIHLSEGFVNDLRFTFLRAVEAEANASAVELRDLGVEVGTLWEGEE